MMDLRLAYEGNDLAKFERTLHDKRNRMTEDPFVMTYLGPLRQRIRESVLLHLCKPYKKITMSFMAGVSACVIEVAVALHLACLIPVQYQRYIAHIINRVIDAPLELAGGISRFCP